jgi:hypothetical protein
VGRSFGGLKCVQFHVWMFELTGHHPSLKKYF